MMTDTVSPPDLQDVTLVDHGQSLSVRARCLGRSTSKRAHKTRWFEVEIYKTDDGEYLVQTRGMTVIPGEITKTRVVRTRSSFEVVQVLEVGRHNETPYLPRDSLRALAQAAQWDDDLMERYLDERG